MKNVICFKDEFWQIVVNNKSYLEHKYKQKLKEKAEIKTFHTDINTKK